MGGGVFVETARRAQELYPDDDSALEAAKSLEGNRAQRIIHGVLTEIAEADGIEDTEEGLLSELAATWGIPTQ
jgi:hypothetical protein